VRGQDGLVVAAGSLDEALVARDAGTEAVTEYESSYGVVPEALIPADATGYHLEEITAGEFEALWQRGRQALGT
jgi:hypothetical protein